MSGYPEHIIRQNDAARFGQSGQTNLSELIEKYRNSSSADVRRLARAAEAVMYAAQDLQWMARRYADGRSTYAPGMHNEHTRTLLGLGVKLNATGDGTLYAADGMFGPPPEGMGEEWSSYQSERKALLDMIEGLRLRAEAAEKAIKPQPYRHKKFGYRAELLYRGEGATGSRVVLARVFDRDSATSGELWSGSEAVFDQSWEALS